MYDMYMYIIYTQIYIHTHNLHIHITYIYVPFILKKGFTARKTFYETLSYLHPRQFLNIENEIILHRFHHLCISHKSYSFYNFTATTICLLATKIKAKTLVNVEQRYECG